MKFKFRFTSLVAAVMLLAATASYAQTTVTQTTLSAAISATATSVTLASTTGVAANTGLFMDRESMVVKSVNTTTRVAQVTRGSDGTASAAHVAAAIVYVGPASGVVGQGPFWAVDPNVGSCTAASEQYSLHINVQNGRIWSCTGGQWMNVVDAYQWVSATNCNTAVSGNSTGTNGYTILGTSVPVVNAQTSASGTNLHFYTCSIPLPTRTYFVKSAYLVDAEFYYGIQTTGLGTQAVSLSAGSLNGVVVFSKVAYPTPGASETPTDATSKTRADAGTLTIAPAAASFNVATTTAGSFYSAKFTPATPFALYADRTQYFFNVALLGAATSATITNSPGFVVHYRTLQAGF